MVHAVLTVSLFAGLFLYMAILKNKTEARWHWFILVAVREA
jgi:hypothetical protein